MNVVLWQSQPYVYSPEDDRTYFVKNPINQGNEDKDAINGMEIMKRGS